MPLRGATLQGAPFQGAPFQGAPLRGAPRRGAPLWGAPPSGARPRGRAPSPVCRAEILEKLGGKSVPENYTLFFGKNTFLVISPIKML